MSGPMEEYDAACAEFERIRESVQKLAASIREVADSLTGDAGPNTQQWPSAQDIESQHANYRAAKQRVRDAFGRIPEDLKRRFSVELPHGARPPIAGRRGR